MIKKKGRTRRYSTTTPAVTCRACARPAPAGAPASSVALAPKMKVPFCFLVILALVLRTNAADAQLRAKCENGRIVILEPDGRWSYAEPFKVLFSLSKPDSSHLVVSAGQSSGKNENPGDGHLSEAGFPDTSDAHSQVSFSLSTRIHNRCIRQNHNRCSKVFRFCLHQVEGGNLFSSMRVG